MKTAAGKRVVCAAMAQRRFAPRPRHYSPEAPAAGKSMEECSRPLNATEPYWPFSARAPTLLGGWRLFQRAHAPICSPASGIYERQDESARIENVESQAA